MRAVPPRARPDIPSAGSGVDGLLLLASRDCDLAGLGLFGHRDRQPFSPPPSSPLPSPLPPPFLPPPPLSPPPPPLSSFFPPLSPPPPLFSPSLLPPSPLLPLSWSHATFRRLRTEPVGLGPQ